MTYSLPNEHQPPPSSLCYIDAPPKREQTQLLLLDPGLSRYSDSPSITSAVIFSTNDTLGTYNYTSNFTKKIIP